MGLFDKKVCSVCGNDIKLLGNRKLSDGNLCKDCASKLSPWFSERRSSTVAEIQEQLAYREENKKALGSFNPNVTLGESSTLIHLDENAKKFIVTRQKNWKDGNPDIISLSQIRDCKIEVDEDREEEFTTGEGGKKESYNPPRFTYEYGFEVELDIDSPYFSEIKFDLTDGKASAKEDAVYNYYMALGKKLQATLLPDKYRLTPAEVKILRDGLKVAVEQAEAAAKEAEAETAVETENQSEPAATVETNSTTDDVTRWFCPNCGTECHGNFCVKCGNKKPVM